MYHLSCPRPPAQGKTDDRKGDDVIIIRRVSQKIERVGSQADRAGDDAGDDLDRKHGEIYAERRAQHLPISAVGWRRGVAMIAAIRGHL
jgi:hypothetical protein